MKKSVLLLSSISILLLSGCSIVSNTIGKEYYKDAYFLTKTGKIKRPYGMKSDEIRAIRSKGPQGNGSDKTISYATDGVVGLYNQQFVKEGTSELDMDLVRSEMDIQRGGEKQIFEKMYLCENSNMLDDIKELNDAVKNNIPKLEEIASKEVSQKVHRENVKTEIVTLTTISSNDKGKVACNENIRTIVNVAKQQDLPGFLMLVDFEYFSKDEKLNKTFHISNYAGDRSQFFNSKVQSYLQYEAKKQQFDQLQQKIRAVLGKDYILNSEIDNMIHNETKTAYTITDGMMLSPSETKQKYLDDFLQKKIKPNADAVNSERTAQSPETVYLEIRPTKESEIVTFERLEAIRSEIKAASKEIFGYEIKIGISANGSFRILKSGVKEKLIGADEMYRSYLDAK